MRPRPWRFRPFSLASHLVQCGSARFKYPINSAEATLSYFRLDENTANATSIFFAASASSVSSSFPFCVVYLSHVRSVEKPVGERESRYT
uniref:Putative secreted protein n=1 Tax=Ixodes ricinus TaxID=34613 RepID=A0A6B0UCZ9_IXORI